MSEKFNSSNMGDFIRKIDVRGDGKQDGKEEERLEQLAIDRLNQMQTNGATTDQLEKAFEDFADALIQKYVPLIEANIAQVSVLY
jgi:hypothetical protein